MTSSNCGLKIASTTQNCRRKLKLYSHDAKYQADSENILYVNIFFINRRARASAHEQKCIFRVGGARRRRCITCRRKPKLDSNHSESQVLPKNI